MGEWQLLSERLPVIDRGREIVQPATSSSHCPNPTTGATGTRSLHGSPLFPLYTEEQRKGRQGMDPGTGPAQQSKPPVPGIAPGAGDTFVKRINRARDGFRAPPPTPPRPTIDFLIAIQAALSLMKHASHYPDPGLALPSTQ